MPLPLLGTVSVTNGLDTFVWTGASLTALNCVPGATIAVNGVTYFIKEAPSDTTHGKFTRNYAGATNASVVAELQQMSPDQVATATLNKRTADLLAQLSVVEANGRGFFYRFAATAADADPGPGNLRLNNLSQTSATAAYFDNLDANGATVSGVLDTFDDSTSTNKGRLYLRQLADPSISRAYSVTGAVVDGNGYRKLTVAHIGGAGAFADGDELMIQFDRTGDQAVIGAGSVANSNLAPMTSARIKGRASGGAGDPEDLTAAQALTLIGAEPARTPVTQVIAEACTDTTVRGWTAQRVGQAVMAVESCKAWVNFNGSSGAIRGSKNVSSVTRYGVGNYAVNLTAAMPSANYAVLANINAGGGYPADGDFGQQVFPYVQNASQFSVYPGFHNGGSAYGRIDPVFVFAAAFG